jgi:hypothetical protein
MRILYFQPTLHCLSFRVNLPSEWRRKSARGIDGIVVDLYDSSFLKEELLGSVLIPRSALTPNKFVKTWHPIESARISSAEHAEILLEVMFIQGDPENEDEVVESSEDEEEPGTRQWLKKLSSNWNLGGLFDKDSPEKDMVLFIF